MIAAAWQWPRTGVPAQPQNWLITVAGRRRVEQLRNDAARRRREEAVSLEPGPVVRSDAELALLLCCRPALRPPTQITLTLRAVGGLTAVHQVLYWSSTRAQHELRRDPELSGAEPGGEPRCQAAAPPPALRRRGGQPLAPTPPTGSRANGALIPLAEQDRSRWDAAAIAEGSC